MGSNEIDAVGTWTKLNGCWMVKVVGDVAVRGDYLDVEVSKRDGGSQMVMTMTEPELAKDGFAIYCPIKSRKSSRVAERNARANARSEGAVFRNGCAYYV
jgi:hypothetical protein